MNLNNLSILYVGIVGNQLQNSTKHWEIISSIIPKSMYLSLDNESRLSQRRFLRRIDGKAFTNQNIISANEKLLRAVDELNPNIIWFEKPLIFTPDTLTKIKLKYPKILLVSRQDDNPFGLRSFEKPFWHYFIKNIPFFDIHFVKRESDKDLFLLNGAKKISFFWSGYDEKYFYPPVDQRPVRDLAFSFIGTNFDGRGRFILELQRILGLNNFYVAGANWDKSLLKFKFPKCVSNLEIPDTELRSIYLRSYACLGLFSTSNMDEFSGRSFMISASGAPLVAPKSKMHDYFFIDGEEALFFNNVDECASMINRLIQNPKFCDYISNQGAIRCISGGYSLKERVTSALSEVIQLFIIKNYG